MPKDRRYRERRIKVPIMRSLLGWLLSERRKPGAERRSGFDRRARAEVLYGCFGDCAQGRRACSCRKKVVEKA